MWIAWNINSDNIRWPPSTIEEKVEIFYQRALGWQLHIADLIANGGEPSGKSGRVEPLSHSGFAVLQICLSYFETIGNYEQKEFSRGTKRTSFRYFEKGVRSVLPQLLALHGETVFDELVERLYSGARCGLYHKSMTVPGVGLGQPSGGASVDYDSDAKILAMSPERLPKDLKLHLERFCTLLLDPKNVELRQNFERRFDEDNGIPERK